MADKRGSGGCGMVGQLKTPYMKIQCMSTAQVVCHPKLELDIVYLSNGVGGGRNAAPIHKSFRVTLVSN